MVKKPTAVCCSVALLALSSRRACAAWVKSPISTARDTCVGRSFTSSAVIRMASSSSSTTTTEEETFMTVAINLDLVKKRIEATTKGCGRDVDSVRLVAVSKTKPLELLMDAYNHGQRVFGENYVQELVGKASEMPNDVVWHFIGPLQSNKANLLVKSVVPHAAKLCVETVATTKLANKLNNAVSEFEGAKLTVYVQVNTSGEESKSGVTPGNEVIEVAKHIVENCENLELSGLMTIGAPGDVTAFDVLSKCRGEVEEALGLSGLELSMGMSGDYEKAIEKGATNIRVGSTIFGARDYSTKA